MYDACNEEGPMVFTFLNTTDVFSPDYPGAYPNSISCTWKFLALDGFTIQFNFQEGGEIESGYDMLIFKLITCTLDLFFLGVMKQLFHCKCIFIFKVMTS